MAPWASGLVAFEPGQHVDRVDADFLDRAAADQGAGRDVLVLSGARDDRTPFATVSRVAVGMRAGGSKVELAEFTDADHFLFFSHADAVLGRPKAWLAERMCGGGASRIGRPLAALRT